MRSCHRAWRPGVCGLFAFSLGGYFTFAGALTLLAVFVVYIIENVGSARYMTETGEDSSPSTDRKAVCQNLGRVVVGAVCIVFGSRFMVDNGSSIAVSLGVSEAIIGVTIIAIGTSLPELVTAITSLVKKESSMSVGNVIGANIIDTTLILAVCSLVYGGKLPVSAQNLYLDFPVAILITLIATVPTIFRKKFSHWQGILMLALYAVYLVVITTGLDRYLLFVGA